MSRWESVPQARRGRSGGSGDVTLSLARVGRAHGSTLFVTLSPAARERLGWELGDLLGLAVLRSDGVVVSVRVTRQAGGRPLRRLPAGSYVGVNLAVPEDMQGIRGDCSVATFEIDDATGTLTADLPWDLAAAAEEDDARTPAAETFAP